MTWRAHLEYDFLNGVHRLYLADRRTDGSTDVLGADGAMHHVQDDGRVIDFPIPTFPYEALQAIAEAVKPGPTQETVDVLRETLAVERERVDRVITYAVEARS